MPWHGKVVLGTTDTPLNEASLEPRALEEEVDFILDQAGQYLDRKPTRADVLSILPVCVLWLRQRMLIRRKRKRFHGIIKSIVRNRGF